MKSNGFWLSERLRLVDFRCSLSAAVLLVAVLFGVMSVAAAAVQALTIRRRRRAARLLLRCPALGHRQLADGAWAWSFRRLEVSPLLVLLCSHPKVAKTLC